MARGHERAGKVLFDSPEELHLFDPGAMTPAPHVAEHIPDAGAFFVDWAIRGLNQDRAREIESAVNGRRNQNGWFPLETLDSIGSRGFWRGPLTYLARMTADDPRILQEWACDGLRDEQVGRIEATVDHLLHQAGPRRRGDVGGRSTTADVPRRGGAGRPAAGRVGVQPRLDPSEGRGEVSAALEPLRRRTTGSRQTARRTSQRISGTAG